MTIVPRRVISIEPMPIQEGKQLLVQINVELQEGGHLSLALPAYLFRYPSLTSE